MNPTWIVKNSGIYLAVLLGIWMVNARAEILFNGSVTPITGAMNVNEADGTRVGTNLFHDFSIFNVNNGESVTFNAVNPTSHIVARVTGNSFTTIDGPVNSTVAGADLWIFNPLGILFNANASLNLQGSFHASSADYLRFDDGGRYDATDTANINLTSGNPSAFGFYAPAAGSVVQPILVFDSVLQVPEGETLELVAGNIDITGGVSGILAAQSGVISLASVAGEGEAAITPAGVNVDAFPLLGDISLSDNSLLTVSETPGTGGGGSVFIRGGNLMMDNSLLSDNTSVGSSGVLDIKVSNDLTMTTTSAIFTGTNGAGNAAAIGLEVGGKLSLADGSKISSATQAGGNAGTITVVAGDVEIAGAGSLIFNSTSAEGAGGSTTITSNTLTISNNNGADFTTGINHLTGSTFPSGQAGDVIINTGTLTMNGGVIVSESLSGPAPAGDVTITAGTVDVNGGALVSTSTRGSGVGGTLTVNADRIDLSGIHPTTTDVTSFQSSTSGTGKGGNMIINAADINLLDGAMIAGAVFSSGAGGGINVTTQRLLLDNGRISSDGILFSSGTAGNITVNAGESILLRNTARDQLTKPSISSASLGTGNGGKILLNTPKLALNFASISTSALADGNAGEIELNVGDLQLHDFGLISSDSGSNGNSGLVTINATGTVDIRGGVPPGNGGALLTSAVTTSSTGAGNAGNININAGSLNITGVGDVNAVPGIYNVTTGSGLGGSINITATRVNLDGVSQISAESRGTQDAGTIDISVSDRLILADSQLSSRSENAAGAAIHVEVGNILGMARSKFITSANGNGGDINIGTITRSNFLVMNKSQIRADAKGGNGGNVNLLATNFINDLDSAITASSALGTEFNGVITVDAISVDLVGAVTQLEVSFSDIAALLSNQCAADHLQNRSSFTVAGQAQSPSPEGYWQSTALQRSTAALDRWIGDRLKLARRAVSPCAPPWWPQG